MVEAGAIHDPVEDSLRRQGIAAQPRELLLEVVKLPLNPTLHAGPGFVAELRIQDALFQTLDAVLQVSHDLFVVIDQHVEESVDEKGGAELRLACLPSPAGLGGLQSAPGPLMKGQQEAIAHEAVSYT